MMMRVVDIGANLTSGQFRRDLPQVLRRAKHAGVDTIVITGTNVVESRRAIQLARLHAAQDATLFTTVGVHPHDAKDFDEHSTTEEMRLMIASNGDVVVAIGECGLDFNRDYSPREAQMKAFGAQVALASELKMPLFVHEREAHEALVEVLNPFVESGVLPPTVVHCFTGTEKELGKYLDMGLYIGLTGFVCMEPRGLEVRNMVDQIPLDRLMIETDAPFMYPYAPGRQKKRARCEPKDIVAVVQTLASCYGITEEEITRATTENARRFFRFTSRQAYAKVTKRMFFAGDGPSGHVQVSMNPIDSENHISAIELTESSISICHAFVRVTSFGSSANQNMADHYASALRASILKEFTSEVDADSLTVEEECIVETTTATPQKKTFRGKKPKEKTAISVLVMLQTATGGIISVDRTVNVNESTANILANQVTSKLYEHVQSGTCVDEHLADNAIVFMALAQGISRLRVPCKSHRTSQHLETALEVTARLTGASYRITEEDSSAVVEVDGIGHRRIG
ncbi:RNA 3'-phosphate cyclase [Phytophthora megakarya]|uniref:RNA 3'-phosphate cyclase n=1 Tax=Phytophthora megakarya TaxID=4795 RepID=A0A225VIR8_9STRA|nr:RNA 3'-phosphate cyclase [Phytophthora megakarya]